MAEPVTQFALDRVDTVALVTMDDGSGPGRPNVFGRAALESLARLLPELEQGDFSALVITGKQGSFSGGADVKEFPRIERREQAIEGSRAGHELFGRIRALPYPTVAAINGGVLGGGVELALHCDYRVIADDVRHFASPECLLGFVPAWGATQLAPRIAGPEAAVKLIALNPMRQNKMLNAAQAHELGLRRPRRRARAADRRGDGDRRRAACARRGRSFRTSPRRSRRAAGSSTTRSTEPRRRRTARST